MTEATGAGSPRIDRLGRAARGRRAQVRARIRYVWVNRWLVTQAGIAAGIAWFLARDVLGHATPFFAPISAVIVLGGAAGHRLGRTVELVAGVAVGIVVGDLLVVVLGTGPVQLAVVVGLAVAVALLLGSGPLLANQAAASAVLIATLYPPSGGIYYGRWLDALVGGLVAFTVHALLLPLDPLAAVRRAVGPILETLADSLAAAARSVRSGEPAGAGSTLDVLRGAEPSLRQLTEVLTGARETAAVSPIWWRARDRIGRYLVAAPHIDHAMRNARVLARRELAALQTAEGVPDEVARALDDLAAAVRALNRDLEQSREPERTRELAVRAATVGADVYRTGVGLSTAVVAGQVRSVALDLLLASGLDDAEARAAIVEVEP